MQVHRQEKGRAGRAAGNVAGILLMLMMLGAACACALHVHYHGIAGAGGFLAVALITYFAQGFLALMLDARFGRPTNGTSGALGVAMIWAVARLAIGAALIICGLLGVGSYVGVYVTLVILCGIIDTGLVVAGL